ncbi:hypothetical protein ACFWNL_35775 [Kitasatospora sp. NPDC058397]|uniref:hypothetical protein n=1 Tax=unclassified Kitasatospora TaxID=2633591 RepID=UPI003655CE5C
MNRRPRVAASLAGAVIALASPSADVAAQASARHAFGSLWIQDGDGVGEGGHHDHNPPRDCHSARRVILIDQSFRIILKNGRHGPEALVLQGSTSSPSSSPAAPWDNFAPSTYLDVNYPTQTSNQYEWQIRDFFREHPLFVVKAFDRHERVFSFPATHCIDKHDGGERGDGDRGDGALLYGGGAADGSDPSGSPSPQATDRPQDGQSASETPSSGATIPPPPRSAAAEGRHSRLLSADHVGIAVGGLLVVLGVLATAWIRRRSGT